MRSAKYDKLYWTKDKPYLQHIIKTSCLKKSDIVLDVGTGTGIVAKAVKPHVNHVVGLDMSDSMLNKGNWQGCSVIKWDVSDLIFANNIFDKIIARMVFHHVLDNLDRALLRCYDMLKDKGILTIAEGVPPSEDKDVIDWYSHMFSFKEKRRTFTAKQLQGFLEHNGFSKIKSEIYTMKKFSIKNWLVNSGIDKKAQEKILKLHFEASPKIKKLYNMKITKNDCFVDTKNVIIVGQKDLSG
jgi:ubiquinone/menaquinone biosynthesis C-methylase UbiE